MLEAEDSRFVQVEYGNNIHRIGEFTALGKQYFSIHSLLSMSGLSYYEIQNKCATSKFGDRAVLIRRGKVSVLSLPRTAEDVSLFCEEVFEDAKEVVQDILLNLEQYVVDDNVAALEAHVKSGQTQPRKDREIDRKKSDESWIERENYNRKQKEQNERKTKRRINPFDLRRKVVESAEEEKEETNFRKKSAVAPDLSTTYPAQEEHTEEKDAESPPSFIQDDPAPLGDSAEEEQAQEMQEANTRSLNRYYIALESVTINGQILKAVYEKPAPRIKELRMLINGEDMVEYVCGKSVVEALLPGVDYDAAYPKYKLEEMSVFVEEGGNDFWVPLADLGDLVTDITTYRKNKTIKSRGEKIVGNVVPRFIIQQDSGPSPKEITDKALRELEVVVKMLMTVQDHEASRLEIKKLMKQTCKMLNKQEKLL